MSLSRPVWVLPGLLAALLSGCVAKPPERPIVLRPSAKPEQGQARRSSSHAAPARAGGRDEAPHEAAPLTPEQRETLFRDFDDYLARSGRAP